MARDNKLRHYLTERSSDFADIFKTPGKLRGKTPRTARKNDPQRAVRSNMLS